MMEGFKYYGGVYRTMTEVILENVSQLLKKTVKSDGRIGGLQQYCDEEVCVVIYDKEINNE